MKSVDIPRMTRDMVRGCKMKRRNLSHKYFTRQLYMMLAFFLVVAACSSSNSNSNFNLQTGQHVSGWYPLGHKAAALVETVSCTQCHGSDYMGGISGVSCRQCHINKTPGSFSCSECHGYPPTTDNHSSHEFQNVSCIDCHIDTVGTSRHNNGVVDIVISAAYNANSGPATYTASGNTCSNVRCHGGPRTQTSAQAGANPPQSTVSQTLSWLTGTMDVSTQCTACHVYGTEEYNSYRSGHHYFHVYGQNIACTTCHDTAKLAVNHFTTLNTPVMEGPASATLQNALNFNGTSCHPACHETQTW